MTVLGQLLIKSGLVTSRQVEAALRRQEQLGGRLGTCLLELGAISEWQLDAALAKQLGLPAAQVEDLRRVSDDIHSLLPANLAISCEAVPFRVRDDQVDVAILEIKNRGLHDELAFVIGKWIHVHIANEVRIFEALQRFYGRDCTLRYRTLIERLDRDRAASEAAPAGSEADDLFDIPSPDLEGQQAEDQRGPQLVYPPAPVTRRSIELTIEERQSLKKDRQPEPVPEVPKADSPPVAPATVEQHPSAPWPAESAEQIGRLLLSKLEKHFSKAVLFRIQRDRVKGWIGFGDGLGADRLQNYETALDQASVLSSLVQGGNLFVGRLAHNALHTEMFEALRTPEETECLLAVVTVSGRVVAIVFGERGRDGLDTLDFAAVQQLTQRAGGAMHDLLLQKKRKQA